MKIVHIDMDMFFAAVEIRDNPELAGKPLIIGALPGERGVVATCSYEARKYGVRSAMSVAEAYKRCPHGIFMHPKGDYYGTSLEIQKIWADYTDLIECVSLDEAFLDVTGSEHLFGGAANIGHEIRRRVHEETGLTCSVGIGYSLMSAKVASEEKKPDGFFEIPTPEALLELIIDRGVRTIYGIGAKTAEELRRIGITTVRGILESEKAVLGLFGKHGTDIVNLAKGIDNRKVTPYAYPKSIGKEHTFQQDIGDFNYLRDVLLLISQKLSFEIRVRGMYCRTVTLKVTYPDMRQITRSKSGDATDKSSVIYRVAADLLTKIDKRPVRLIGLSLSGLSDAPNLQMNLFNAGEEDYHSKFNASMLKLQLKYGRRIIKTANELRAEAKVRGLSTTPRNTNSS